jgi:hypothetical protein
MRTLLRSIAALLVTSWLGCGPSDDSATEQAEADTPYGNATEVSAYLTALQPNVQRVSELQREYEQALSSAAQDATSRRGTGRNLATKAEQVRPQLVAVLDQIDAIQPPALLAPFHRDTKKMVVARLEAYAKTMEGWEVEQAGGDFEAVYREAEQRLQEANALIRQLSERFDKISSALQQAEAAAATSSS